MLVSASEVDGRTVAVLFFDGAAVEAGSLADGTYTLTFRADGIRDGVGRAFDGDGDAMPGGDRVEGFFRLFGDGDGDGDVDQTDLDLLDSSLGLSGADPGFLWYFDYDGDDDVDEKDREQLLLRLSP